MEEEKITANFRISQVRVILYTESEPTNEEPACTIAHQNINQQTKQKDNRPQSRVFVSQTRGSFLTADIVNEKSAEE